MSVIYPQVTKRRNKRLLSGSAEGAADALDASAPSTGDTTPVRSRKLFRRTDHTRVRRCVPIDRVWMDGVTGPDHARK
jgi:hypothetical protein